MSEHGFSETSSLLTATATFTSTIPGLGATSGKVIKRLGSVVVYGVDAILIRRRLAQIEGILTHKRLEKLTKESPNLHLYNDLLELSRPLYSLTLCTRAFRLIMGEVGGMEFEDLAAAVVNWDVSLSYDLLKAIMICLQSEGNLEGSSASNTLPTQYYAEGLDAYKTRLPYGSEDSSKSDLCVAFLMFLGLVISLSRSPALSRIVAAELDLVSFMTKMCPSLLEPRMPWSGELLRAESVLIALLKKLDPVNDYQLIARLNKILSLTTTEDVASPSSNELSTTSESEILASIRSNIAYLQNANHRLAQAEDILGPNSHSGIPSYSLKSKSVYGDILDLSRPAYNLSIRTRAFCLIMGEVGGMEFEDLAAAVINWDMSLSYDILRAIMFCLQLEGNLEGSSASSALPAQYYAAGLHAYKTRLPYKSGDSSKSDFCVAFLMFMGLAISLSRSSAFSRLVATELDLVSFMTQIYPSFLKPKMPWSRELLRAELVLIALLEKLDPVNDYQPIARLHEVLSLTTTKDVASSSSYEPSMISLGIDVLASIRSSIAYSLSGKVFAISLTGIPGTNDSMSVDEGYS